MLRRGDAVNFFLRNSFVPLRDAAISPSCRNFAWRFLLLLVDISSFSSRTGSFSEESNQIESNQSRSRTDKDRIVVLTFENSDPLVITTSSIESTSGMLITIVLLVAIAGSDSQSETNVGTHGSHRAVEQPSRETNSDAGDKLDFCPSVNSVQLSGFNRKCTPEPNADSSARRHLWKRSTVWLGQISAKNFPCFNRRLSSRFQVRKHGSLIPPSYPPD